jgi:pimeloyl-ACP methyl ester carboxylesterase
MKIHSQSKFKNESVDKQYFENWVSQLETLNDRRYDRIEVSTSLGKTHVWSLVPKEGYIDTLVIFPGARTTSLIWDFDKGLDHLNHPLRIFMVETNGLPNLSDGSTPDIKTLDYGHWATEIFDQLQLDQAFVAGASFGGLIALKFGIVSPNRIKAAFLLNPGCLQTFSLTLKNLYYNLLPVFKPTKENVSKFLDMAIFSKPNHQISSQAEQLLVDYEVFAISRYLDKAQKPYYMGKQLEEVSIPVYLLLGDQDLLFPVKKSLEVAKKQLKNLFEAKVYPLVGHGIEIYAPALKYIGEKINSLK